MVDRREWLSTGGRALLAAGAAAGAALAGDGVGVVAAGLTPVAERLLPDPLGQAAAAALAVQQDQAALALALALGHAGVSSEDLARRMRGDAGLRELTVETVRAAGSAVADAKIEALSRHLAEGLQRPDSHARHRIWVSAIGALEAPHLWLLELLRDGRPQVEGEEDDGRGIWELAQIVAAMPDLADETQLLLSTLTQTGLVSLIGGITYTGAVGDPRYQISPAGRRVLRDLEDAAQAVGPVADKD